MVVHLKTAAIYSSSVDIATYTYPVVETFHSIQGEGQWCGVSAFFIRLGGCDVGCSWCDTKISWNPKRHPSMTVSELRELVEEAQPRIVVITGGEPLMHNLQPLTEGLKSLNMPIHLETSGAHPLSGNFDWITLSPKMFKPPLAAIYDRVQELKVVIDGAEDLAWAESQAVKVASSIPKYLQPQWTNETSQGLIFKYILAHPTWRLGLQTHKFLGVQ